MLTTDQWINLSSSFIGAIIGGVFTLAGVSLGIRKEKIKQIKLGYQQQIEEMMYFDDTIETIALSATALTFDGEIFEAELNNIDKAYEQILSYVKITSNIDLKLSLLLRELAEEVFTCRLLLKHNEKQDHKNEKVPKINFLLKKVLKRHKEILDL